MYVAIDFETSSHENTSACAIGMVRIENGVLDPHPFYALIRPPSPHVLFTHIHGLRWKDLKNAPTFAELWPDIAAYVAGATAYIAHNAHFDQRVLWACCAAEGFPLPHIPFFCTVRGAKKAFPTLRTHTLDALCEHFSIPLVHHHAAHDAVACAKIFLRICAAGISEDAMQIGPPKKW